MPLLLCFLLLFLVQVPSLLAQELTSAEENDLGIAYAQGEGVEQSDSKAVFHFRRSAEQGNSHGQHNLGLMYYNRRGFEDEFQGKSNFPQSPDFFKKEAFRWFREAAKRGNLRSQYNFEILLKQDKTLAKTPIPKIASPEIKKILASQKAGAKLNSAKENELGIAYAQGKGVEQSDAKAVLHFRRSAEKGNSDGQHNLGLMYYNLRGFYKKFQGKSKFPLSKKLFQFVFDPQFKKEAKKWFQSAAKRGNPKAQHNLKLLLKQEKALAKKRLPQKPKSVTKKSGAASSKAVDLASLGAAAQEVQIFALSPDLVLKPSGVFRVRVSAFVPLQSVSVNGAFQTLAGKQEYQGDFSIPYTKLTPGENKFLIETSTQLGKQKKKLIVFYETDKVKRKSKKKGKAKGPFALIAIFAYSDDVKYSTKGTTHSFKGNTILLPSWKHKLEGGSTLALKGLFVKDLQYELSKGMFMKKLTLEWARPKTPVGDVTLDIGMDWLSLKDKKWKSPERDPWLSALKKQASNVASSIKLKNKVDKTTSWNVKLSRKNKRTYVCKTGASSCILDGSGHSTAFNGGYSFKKWTLSNQFQASYTDSNENKDSKDKFSYSASWKSTYAIKPVKLSLQLKSTETKNRHFAVSTGITTHDRKDELTSNISYPFKPWMIFALSRKMQKQTSNLSNREYQKNIHKIQVTLMF